MIDRPLYVFLGSSLVSLIANIGRVESVGSDAIKALLFLLSFVLVIYLVASLVRSQRDLDFQVNVLVYGGAVVAFSCVVERWTHYNVFNHLSAFVPGLHWTGDPTISSDSRGYRVTGSSQHPIAMGVALVMLVPLAVYRAFASRRTIAWLAAVLMILGSLGTISRTAIVAYAGVVVTMLILKPVRIKRMWPAVDSAASRGAPGDARYAGDDQVGVLPIVGPDRAAAGRPRGQRQAGDPRPGPEQRSSSRIRCSARATGRG